MNILELIAKRHPQVRVERLNGATGAWMEVPDAGGMITKVSHVREERKFFRRVAITEQIRGLRVEPGTRIVVKEAARHWPRFTRGEGVFYTRSQGKAQTALVAGWAEGGRPLESARVVPAQRLAAFHVPATASRTADLVLEMPADAGGPAFLGVHRLLDRAQLFRLCKGKGMEIGPGPKPQILPSAEVDVTYVEQATPDQWQALYGKDTKTPVDAALWERYVVGNADKVPAAPASLDFIFSSHVIEHLANPLGHLAYWNSLLKKGGVVAAVIPDMEGCKDFVYQPSPVDELLGEYKAGDMDVKLRHYERWTPHRVMNGDPQAIMDSGRSIHVHFYTPDSMEAALTASYKTLGFRSFEVVASPNHKDFFVVLRK